MISSSSLGTDNILDDINEEWKSSSFYVIQIDSGWLFFFFLNFEDQRIHEIKNKNKTTLNINL